MASVAASSSRLMITPQQQLELLTAPVEELSREVTESESFQYNQEQPIVRDVLSQPDLSSRVLRELSAVDQKNLLNVCTATRLLKRKLEKPFMNRVLSYWYTALERIHALPEKIPALPQDILQILSRPCPIYRNKHIYETHSLYLIPPGTINELEQTVCAYGQTLGFAENSLQFRYFSKEARQEHANVSFHEYQWILISNDVLPGSRNLLYQRQAQMVADLSKKSFTDYQVPTLREAVAAIFLHKIATGESLYPAAGNEQNYYVYTYTRVQETTDGWRLVVGGSAPSGVDVHICGYDNGSIGVVALRKF